MRILLLVVSLLVSVVPQYGLSADITMAECNTTIADLNKPLPMELDTITTWVNTSCVEQSDKSIQLVYENRVKDGNSISQTELDTVRPSIIMSWCYGPTLSPLLEMVDTVNYQYYFENGDHIGELNFSSADCSLIQ